jgi:hypothetical protein
LRLVQSRSQHADHPVRRRVPEDQDQLRRSGLHRDRLNDHRGTQTVEQGAEAIVRYALIAADGPTGGFFDRNGTEPW